MNLDWVSYRAPPYLLEVDLIVFLVADYYDVLEVVAVGDHEEAI